MKILKNKEYQEYLEYKKSCEEFVEEWDNRLKEVRINPTNDTNNPTKCWDKGIGVCQDCGVIIPSKIDKYCGDYCDRCLHIGMLESLPCKEHEYEEIIRCKKCGVKPKIIDCDREPCPQENIHCSCTHIPYEDDGCSECRPCYEFCDCECHEDDIEVLYDRTDDLSGDLATFIGDMTKVIKDITLINKVQNTRIGELSDELERISKRPTGNRSNKGNTKKETK